MSTLHDSEKISIAPGSVVIVRDVEQARNRTFETPTWLRDDVIATPMSSGVTFRSQNVAAIRRGPVGFLLSWIQNPDADASVQGVPEHAKHGTVPDEAAPLPPEWQLAHDLDLSSAEQIFIERLAGDRQVLEMAKWRVFDGDDPDAVLVALREAA